MDVLPVQRVPKKRTYIIRSISLVVILLVGVVLTYAAFFGPASADDSIQSVVIQPDTTQAQVAAQLRNDGYGKSTWALRATYAAVSNGAPIRPGAYDLRKNQDAWSIARTLAGPPRMVFITFPPGIRKEQIGEILARQLGWNEQQKATWNAVATTLDPNFMEGVYYPDTYLIPSDQSPEQIAARMRGRFLEVFAPYAQEAKEKRISIATVLTMASIIDREAGATDKALVSGILWNRLRDGMRLQADATLQYARGTSGAWWPVPKSEDKFIDSPFNTYKKAGLPPHPINNPSMASVAAALNPQETPCLFYLHANNQQIYCSLTYAQHKKNVDTYLR